jgi:phage terminase small subunit
VKFTLKQKAFSDFYIELANATEAAIKAGYSEKYAGQNADKLLKNTNIQNYIKKRMEEIESERIASAEEVLKFLTSAARGEIKEDVVVNEGCGDGCSSAIIIQKQISAKDRIKAAELLGKRYSLFTSKVDISGAIPIIIHGEDDLEE